MRDLKGTEKARVMAKLTERENEWKCNKQKCIGVCVCVSEWGVGGVWVGWGIEAMSVIVCSFLLACMCQYVFLLKSPSYVWVVYVIVFIVCVVTEREKDRVRKKVINGDRVKEREGWLSDIEREIEREREIDGERDR